ncbi:hypothetical protein HanRHA438_Chr04g0199201 [Helianthus annuus]|uniref:Uncharacterized protein n=1 Tax=Helianthus annuus TaxID=4232 RepID=A0A251V2I6_HELAN|nr:hypothetical protein HanXRQr2_Chr04g0189341 [Helianthus annuus]KAJ0591052.1 hypothetical protein HanIR_Chr04g0204131 [Helianthus annuus]KAJ0762974.1 hypothetical protein HanOQP8_Chr04g0167121 [Helianthus annuus]KAJ0928912.1 hypothetical protein HanRHA438_Chr04g0199201 [Helianthus annuus]KAJ0933271.1 hypothetical protein HanPSC8_Chr04g0182941 [Helianthus annuus]
MATPGGPRPAYIPPNFNPNLIADNMQNLQLNRPNLPPDSGPGPRGPVPPFGQQPFPTSAPFSSRPPPNAVPRGAVVPPSGPPQGALPPFMVPNRAPAAAGGGSNQPPSLASRPMGSGPLPSSTTSTRPGPFAGLPVPPQNVGGGGPVTNGPPMFRPGGMQGGPQYPPRPSAGPQPSPPIMSSPAGPYTGQPTPYFGSLPDQPPRGPPAFSAQSPGMPPPQASPFGAQAQPWQMQPRQNVPPPPILGSGQPPRMFGMQPPLPNQQSMATISPAMGAGGSAVTVPSKIDPNQIPRPIPNPSVLLHETRQGNQTNPPPVSQTF